MSSVWSDRDHSKVSICETGACADQDKRRVECVVWNRVFANVRKFLERCNEGLTERIALYFTREVPRQ